MSAAPATRRWLARLLTERLRRLAWLLPLAAALCFALVSLAPTDPVEAFVGARTAVVGPEQRAQIAAAWGLDAPHHERFLRWAGHVLRGDLGTSMTFGAPVAEVIASRFLASLSLMAAAFVISGLAGYGLGLWAGMRAGSPADRAIRGVAVMLASAPGFWVAIVLVAVFAVGLGWAPVCCAAPPGTLGGEATLGQRLHHMILPALALSIVGIAPLVLHTRQRQIETMESAPARLLLAHGAARAAVAFGPGARHAAGPALALHMASLGELFGGSVLAETVFAWPGLGRATIEAALRQDAPLLLGISLFTVLFVFAGNLMAEIAQGLLDPRRREREA